MSRGGDFWARRKAAVAAEAEAEMIAQERAVAAEEQASLEDKPDAEILAELDLPDPDELGPGDDFSAFLKTAVPERLRRRALRKLWLTNPTLANVDGLVDYGEDFTDSAMVVEGMQTAYQIGKGMLKHVEEMARKAEAMDQPVLGEAAEQPAADDEADVPEDVIAMAEVEDATPAEIAIGETDPAAEEIAPSPRRRMRFEFEQPAMERQ
ncbi:uncharacterized protein DUF3306 [Shimia isoporae]|uniref:Uncharacterized protein DUF3306 n=1 Tax=Shimia isoporae TaxID=647720 RepID=A0A4R1N635_9RHOB|nr:DUF3306 domain-containing protein [Shimia isoporae]TCL01552.1 uncharacterized protein DUF3306 [Shimia isoporae]